MTEGKSIHLSTLTWGGVSIKMAEVNVLGHIMQNTGHEIQIFALKLEIDCIKSIRCGLFIILQFIS